MGHIVQTSKSYVHASRETESEADGFPKTQLKHRKEEIYLEGPNNRLKYFESINGIPLRMLAWTNKITALDH